MIEVLSGIPQGIISLYEIPPEFANDDALFKAWWLPEVEYVEGVGNVIVREARLSDEAKAQRLVREPVHNLMTNAGIALYLTNQSVATQGAMFPFYQITSLGNGAITGVTRADTAVAGDGFASGARKAPTAYQQYGFTTTIVTTFGNSDAVGTITNGGCYGYKTSASQNATTTAGTGQLQSHFLLPFVKSNSASYAFSYAWILSN